MFDTLDDTCNQEVHSHWIWFYRAINHLIDEAGAGVSDTLTKFTTASSNVATRAAQKLNSFERSAGFFDTLCKLNGYPN